MKLNTAWMTKPINSLDKMGWGRSGAAAGAAVGGTYGMFSDDTSMMGGAFKGAIMGGLAGKGLRFGSKFLRDEAGMNAYEATSMKNKFFKDGIAPAWDNFVSTGNQAVAGVTAAAKQLKATAVGP